MTEPDNNRFKYDEMANKVLKADRRFISKRNYQESVDSQPKSLKSIIKIELMGSKVLKNEKPKTDTDQVHQAQDKIPESAANSFLLDTINNIEGLAYYPKSQKTLRLYQEISNWVFKHWDEDVPDSILRSATDEILQILNNKSTEKLDTKQEVIKILSSIDINDDDFEQLVDLFNQLEDFNDKSNDNPIDNEVLAVNFSDDDEDGTNSSTRIGFDNLLDADVEIQPPNITSDLTDEDLKHGGYNKDEIIKFESSNNELPLNKITESWIDNEVQKIYNIKISIHKLLDILSIRDENLKNELETLFKGNSKSKLSLNNAALTGFINLLVENKHKIYFRLRFLMNQSDEAVKLKLIKEMNDLELHQLIEEFELFENRNNEHGIRTKKRKIADEKKSRTPKYINLESLKFTQGSRLLTNHKVNLPRGSLKKIKRSYEEIHIPAPKKPESLSKISLIPIKDLPEWTRDTFINTVSLNPVQSTVFAAAFQADENVLMCAPTGSGKTNVAMLTILRTIQNFRDQAGNIAFEDFKIVYISPLKALVQEQVREFGKRLEPLNIKVNELTGDSSLTKHQIRETQIIITTPEKWDIITRKNTDTSYTNLVKLVIIDEIHLLHDERGPVLESIVARTIKQSADINSEIRLVGLSATLPNYEDVAEFLQVSPSGLFYFDASYRPCPLNQQFIGITETKGFRQVQEINSACYDKVLENCGKYQMIIFVHSRKDTFKTADYLIEKLKESENLDKIIKVGDRGTHEILRSESESVNDENLKRVILNGFAIHHAGLSKEDRSVAEDLFSEGHVQVLVSTATLAWGVNLPAHTVIIKGTQVYSPEKGGWTELSPQDILQMLGRAGRPRFDDNGEGIIITTNDEMQFYLAILNQQMPIESQFVSRLVDNINAEVVLGNIKTIHDAVDWLKLTYLYRRMVNDPKVYHVGADYENDFDLKNKRTDLAYSALVDLAKNKLVEFDGTSVSPTELGKISSYYYIDSNSMKIYNEHIKPYSTPVDLFRVFAMSEEFKFIPVRQEEKFEIKTLITKVPIPVKESENDPLSKINVLLQTYISKLKLGGFALIADMVYITQSASRIFRALFEICLVKRMAFLAASTLDICKMIDNRIWLSNSPFRQFPNCPFEIIRKSENSRIPWSYYLLLTGPQELGQAIGTEKFSARAFELLKQFPVLKIRETNVLPITSTLLKFHVTITPTWNWNFSVHGVSEKFDIFLIDCTGEKILYNDVLIVKQELVNKEHFLEFTISLSTNDINKQALIAPNFFICFNSEKWLNCEYRFPIILMDIRLPKKFAIPTELSDLRLISVNDLNSKEFQKYFNKTRNFKYFNKFQSQVFENIYNSGTDLFVGMLKGCGKTVLAELGIFNYFKTQNPGRIIYINPNTEKINELTKLWTSNFENIAGGKAVDCLNSGDYSLNISKVRSNHLILSTPENFELILKFWTRNVKLIKTIGLLIYDDCHAVGMDFTYELIISRMKFIQSQLENNIRILLLSSCIANCKDFTEWLGIDKENIYNFSSQERFQPLEIILKSLSINHYPSFINSWVKTVYTFVSNYLSENTSDNCLIYVSTRSQAIEIANSIILLKTKNELEVDVVISEKYSKLLNQIEDNILKTLIGQAIAIFYEGMNEVDKSLVLKLINAGVIKYILATRDTANWSPASKLVIILGTQFYEGKEHRYIDYSANEVLEMVGSARSHDTHDLGKVFIYTTVSKKEYYKRFLSFSIPVESNLQFNLTDLFLIEIANKIIKSKQDCMDWLTYTFFYRRLQLNPSYYGVKDVSSLGLSEYLSELIEDSLTALENANLILIQENEEDKLVDGDDKKDDNSDDDSDVESENITALDEANIAVHHNTSVNTIESYMSNVVGNKHLKLKNLLEALCLANEFEAIVPIRKTDFSVLTKLYNRIPMKSAMLSQNKSNFEVSVSLKVFILLQAHILRLKLPVELTIDVKTILSIILNLLNSMIDLLSSEGNLIALRLMTFSQMIVQGIFEKDPDFSLRQIPFIDEKLLSRLKENNVSSVHNFIDIEDDEKKLQILGTNISENEDKLTKVVSFLNNYPIIRNVSYTVLNEGQIFANDNIIIAVTVNRDDDLESEEDLIINSNFYYEEKLESWWIVIGDVKTKKLYAIRKVTLKKEQQSYKLNFNLANAGKHNLNIWLICDSYFETEEIDFEIDILQGSTN